MNSHSESLNYIQRTRHYYQTLGFGKPYEWAQFSDVPFSALNKPLDECTVGLVTTAALFEVHKGNQCPGAPYNAAAKFYNVYRETTSNFPDVRISHIAYDRTHTTAEDSGTYFPLNALQQCANKNIIQSVFPYFYGLPTNRSQKTTIEIDCQHLLSHCLSDKIDIALLLPNCPVCHQSVSLAARTLEEAGITTVVIGCAKDIVEHVGVPRLLFNNLPLGNSAGLPNDKASQSLTIELALQLALNASAPRTTEQTPLSWCGDPNWQEDYSNPDKLSAEEIQERREAFIKSKAIAKSISTENKQQSKLKT